MIKPDPQPKSHSKGCLLFECDDCGFGEIFSMPGNRKVGDAYKCHFCESLGGTPQNFVTKAQFCLGLNLLNSRSYHGESIV